MSKLLQSSAVSRKGGTDAADLMRHYVATNPAMVQNHTLGPATPGQKPKGTGAGDHLIEPR